MRIRKSFFFIIATMLILLSGCSLFQLGEMERNSAPGQWEDKGMTKGETQKEDDQKGKMNNDPASKPKPMVAEVANAILHDAGHEAMNQSQLPKHPGSRLMVGLPYRDGDRIVYLFRYFDSKNPIKVYQNLFYYTSQPGKKANFDQKVSPEILYLYGDYYQTYELAKMHTSIRLSQIYQEKVLNPAKETISLLEAFFQPIAEQAKDQSILQDIRETSQYLSTIPQLDKKEADIIDKMVSLNDKVKIEAQLTIERMKEMENLNKELTKVINERNVGAQKAKEMMERLNDFALLHEDQFEDQKSGIIELITEYFPHLSNPHDPSWSDPWINPFDPLVSSNYYPQGEKPLFSDVIPSGVKNTAAKLLDQITEGPANNFIGGPFPPDRIHVYIAEPFLDEQNKRYYLVKFSDAFNPLLLINFRYVILDETGKVLPKDEAEKKFRPLHDYVLSLERATITLGFKVTSQFMEEVLNPAKKAPEVLKNIFTPIVEQKKDQEILQAIQEADLFFRDYIQIADREREIFSKMIDLMDITKVQGYFTKEQANRMRNLAYEHMGFAYEELRKLERIGETLQALYTFAQENKETIESKEKGINSFIEGLFTPMIQDAQDDAWNKAITLLQGGYTTGHEKSYPLNEQGIAAYVDDLKKDEEHTLERNLQDILTYIGE